MTGLRVALEKAVGFHRRGQLREAERVYQSILRAQPAQIEALHGLGLIYLQGGLAEHSERHLGLALLVDPTNAAIHYDRGRALQALGRAVDAVASYDRTIALDPDHAAAYCNRGDALQDQGRVDEALASYDKAIALRADFASAHYRRGNALLHSMRADAALASFDRVIALKPDSVEAFNNRGNALRVLNRLRDAVASYDKATMLRPDHPVAFYNRGFALQDLGRFDDAFASYDRAITLRPDFHEAIKSRGTLKLLLGRMPQGLADFEHRLRHENFPSQPRLREITYWSGEDPAGKSVLVYGDGAFGDLIQFCRYLPLLAARGAQVTLLVPGCFHRILATSSFNVRSVVSLDDSDRFDFRCELMSLPFAFKTDLAAVPRIVDHLERDPDRNAKWREQLNAGSFNIGICWQGNPARNIDPGRSIPLAEFFPISQISGVRLVSLQKHHGLDQLRSLPPDMRVETLGPDFDSGPDAFVDTAAVMANLDLIITSDTAIAHLAAALGRPTWIALRYVPEWRWLLDRSDSPWYPTVRLFRQKSLDEWRPVFEDIAGALRDFLAARTPGDEQS